MLRDGNFVSLGFLPGTLALCLFGLLLVENRAAPGAPEPPARYIGQQTCASCHRAESAQWKTSHHALAMQKAFDGTVLADFNGAAFEHFGIMTTFSRAGRKFLVRTDGPDGTLQDHEVAYTFGVHPSQQYLIAMPGGRYQALGIAWDSRPKDQGGQLAGADPQALTPEQRGAFSVGLMESWAAEMSSADRAEAHLNLGLLQARRGQPDEAEAQYRTALRLESDFVPALVNLADLERARGRDQDGVGLLRQASRAEANNAEAHHALGLLLVRQRKYAEALPELRDASDLAPDNARYAYVYAVALNSTCAPTEALAWLERAHVRFPANWDCFAFGVDRA